MRRFREIQRVSGPVHYTIYSSQTLDIMIKFKRLLDYIDTMRINGFRLTDGMRYVLINSDLDSFLRSSRGQHEFISTRRDIQGLDVRASISSPGVDDSKT